MSHICPYICPIYVHIYVPCPYLASLKDMSCLCPDDNAGGGHVTRCTSLCISSLWIKSVNFCPRFRPPGLRVNHFLSASDIAMIWR